jgi:hypothetical protein
MARTSRTSLVCLVHLVSFVQPNKPDRLNRPNEQGWLAAFFSILLEDAMMVSVLWGLSLLAVLSYLLAQAQQIPAWKVIAEHVVIGVSVIAITHFVGDWIHATLS